MSEAEAAPTIAPEATVPEVLYTDTPAETPEAPAEEAPVEPEAPAEETPEPEEKKANGADEEPITTLSELTDHYELDPDFVQGLKLAIKVDGESGEVTVKDLVAGHQMNAATEKRLEEVKEKSKAQNKHFADRNEQLDQGFAVAAALIKQAEQALEGEFNGIDWNDLKAEDEASFSAQKIEFQERRGNIEKMKAAALESYQENKKEQAEEALDAAIEETAAEQKKLLEAIPDWKDEKKAKAGAESVTNYLVNVHGFDAAEVAKATDHRLIVMAHESMLYRKAQEGAPVAKKKVTKVPKVLKPGSNSEKPKPDNRTPDQILYP